jgi:predicted AlkP superfamily pyrophosphatase or phosphodiesterase
MHPTLVLNVVGLTGTMLGSDTPALAALARDGGTAPIRTITPAVTCPVQATFLTGSLPRDHGIVANGWYDRETAQVGLWRQSNHLVRGEKVWETARRRDPSVTCANLFWWFNMYSSADWSVTPRPIYRADGLKIPEIYSAPASLAGRLRSACGPFPFFDFWGPRSGIRSSEWIAEASAKVLEWHAPSLTLVYLPHLDYNLQRLGPDDKRVRQDIQAIDRVCGRLIEAARARGHRVLVLSEYGITAVAGAVHLNRALREAGLLRVRDEMGGETLDAGASAAFAVADHQVAHVYVSDTVPVAGVKRLIAAVPGVERVLDRNDQRAIGLDHERSGDLIAISAPDRWFTYYYWLDDGRAPDFARTVDIHRKPGYDPAELFVDPTIALPKLKAAWILARKALGFRYLMDLIPLDAGLVRGSHGRPTDRLADGPVCITSERGILRDEAIEAAGIRDLILAHLFEQR